jgi:hypothetical protein
MKRSLAVDTVAAAIVVVEVTVRRVPENCG